MEQKFKNCQSCGMPLKKSPNGGGTNADVSISNIYCSYCYQKGAFKQPDWTATQMQELVKTKMKQMGFPGLLAGLFTKGIPRLKRWAK
jgi:hypothetical protein